MKVDDLIGLQLFAYSFLVIIMVYDVTFNKIHWSFRRL